MFQDFFSQKINDWYSNPFEIAIIFGLLTFILSFFALRKFYSGKNNKNKKIIALISLIIGFLSFYYFPKIGDGLLIFNLLLIALILILSFKLLIIPFLKFLKINL